MNAIETSPFYNEVEREIAENPIMIYSKGTKDFPRCGFTMRLKDTFEQLGVKCSKKANYSLFSKKSKQRRFSDDVFGSAMGCTSSRAKL